ncbi:MAG: hypothetical protein K6G88_07475 [Lachnospiraceae bacterium]|nr:hypothetical protein [Lachnospiraceae bacterium]
MKRLLKRVCAVIVAVTIIISSVDDFNVNAMETSSGLTQKVVCDGVEYKITTQKNGAKVLSEIEGGNKKVKMVYEGNNKIELTGYVLANNEYKVVSSKKINSSYIANAKNVVDNNIAANGVHVCANWGGKTSTSEFWGTPYWYRTKTESGKSYLNIGCKASYTINYSNLSSDKQKRCDKYKSYVKSSSKSFAKAEIELGGTFTISVICAIIVFDAVTLALPAAAIVTAIIAMLGGYAAGVHALVDSYFTQVDARDEYDIVKTYGKKDKK